MISELREVLENVVKAAKEFDRQHKIVDRNPEDLISADRSGSAVLSTLVGNDCAAKMAVYDEAENALRHAVGIFTALLSKVDYKVIHDLARENKDRMKLVFCAARYCMASLETYLVGDMYSSRGKPSAESTRYFDVQEELFKKAEAYKD